MKLAVPIPVGVPRYGEVSVMTAGMILAYDNSARGSGLSRTCLRMLHEAITLAPTVLKNASALLATVDLFVLLLTSV